MRKKKKKEEEESRFLIFAPEQSVHD